MASKHEEISLTFEKGLVTEVEDSVLEPGQAAELLNWEPTAQGGLRTRNGWSGISKTGLTANYKVRGWGTAAVASGGGTTIQTPVVVQSKKDDGGTFRTSVTMTLTGTIAGNVLVATANHADDSGYVAAGWTKTSPTGQFDLFGNEGEFFSKVSAGGSESITISGGGESLETCSIYEVSGIASATPTATHSHEGSASYTLTCASAVGSGFAVQSNGSTNTWTTEGGGGTWTSRANHNPGWNYNYQDIDYKVFSSGPVSDTWDSNSTGVGMMAIFDAGTSTAASNPADFYILMAVATSTGYSIYRILRDSISSGTWELVDSEACDETSAYVSMAVSAGELVWSASTMDNPRHVVLSTLTGADTTDLTDKAGRAVAAHKDRVFVGGSATNASRLYFSGIGTPHTFTTATDYLDIGGDDGEAIEDIVSVEGLLLVCKVNRLYLISGSGIESFFVNELPGGSASTGRAAVRTPYGTVVAGPTDIWVVQGGGVDPLARSLGADYFIQGLVSTAYAQDIVLISDSVTGTVFRVNLVTGAWSNEEVTLGEDQVGHLFSLQSRLYYGVDESTSNVGGTRRLSNTRLYDFNEEMSFRASTGKLALKGPQFEYTPRWIYLQLRNNDDSAPNQLNLLVESDNGSQTFTFETTRELQRFTKGIAAFAGADWIQFTFSAASSLNNGSIDIEKAVLGVDMEAPR